MLVHDNWILEQDLANEVLKAWQDLVNLMADLCNVPAGFIVQGTEQGVQVVIASESDENPYASGTLIAPEVNIFCRKVVEEKTALYVKNATELSEWQTNPEVTNDGFNSYLGYPLMWPNGQVFGTMCVMDFRKTDYDQRYYTLLEHFKKTAERELKLLEQSLHLEALSVRDDLTGLLNRRGFFASIAERIKIAQRQNENMAVCYFDLNGLKKINDTLGHKAGDNIITDFSHALRASLRQTDKLARFGGDEFVALIFVKNEFELLTIDQRLKKYLAEKVNGKYISFSVGVKMVNAKEYQELNIEKAIAEADKAMYKQKHNSAS